MIAFEIAGARTVIPGVYSQFLVQGSLPAPVPAGRSVLVIGEAEEGVPGSELDIRANFFTDFQSVRDFYKSGPIVDACRQIFSKQPSNVFAGAVQRVYVYKTNNSTRSQKVITSPSNFGKLVAARYGEDGNQIKSQIKTGQAEAKPTKTFLWLPSPAAKSLQVSVNGAQSSALSIGAGGLANAVVTALTGVTGLTATGGTARTTNVAALVADVTVSGDTITISKASGTGDFGTNAQVGDVAYIPAGSDIAGAADANSGSYLVNSWSSTSVTLKQLKHSSSTSETNAAVLAPVTAGDVAVGDILVNAPVTVSVSGATATGSGASLEIIESGADKKALGDVVRDADLSIIISAATSSTASVSATVPSAGKLTLNITNGSLTTTPKVGDLIRISRSSILAGATLKNVGLLVVESASAQSLTVSHLYSGMTTEAVASTSMGGNTDVFLYAPSFVSTAIAARRIDSAAERKVSIAASRTTDGATLPTSLIGGNIALELSYYNVSATAATVSIDQNRILTITPTGTGLSAVTVNTKKYKTLQQLVDFLNTQAGVAARLADRRLASSAPSILDMVNAVGCLGLQAMPAYNAKIKKDYNDWKQFFTDNFSLLAFQEGTMVLKSGLPDAEAVASFLTGATLGSTSNASIQSGLDEGLKIDVRLVLPLFSRDAQYDVADTLTDDNSSYTIAAINANVKDHVSTASGSLFKKERFGQCSFDGSFADAIDHVSDLAYERIQLGFQRFMATGADGNINPFLPWMGMAALSAGRAQAVLGTSMLRKPFLLSSVYQIGQQSLFSDSLVQDFNPDDRGQLEEAISAGLLVWREVAGFGIRLESPDLTSRSRDNDPTAWVYERANVYFVGDEVTQTLRNVLENYIGNRTSDTSTAVIKTALENTLRTFIDNGSLLNATVNSVTSQGNSYSAEVSIFPVEALEAILLTVLAERSTT